MAPHNEIGQIGEETVANHLKRQGFRILDTNYRKKWGEIDIIAKNKGIIHFVEVKSVSRETKKGRFSHETWNPEENVDRRKLKKLLRTVETWLIEKNWEGEWQLDVAAVHLDRETKSGTIKIIPNVILE